MGRRPDSTSVGSRRPVTAILTGPRPDEATLESSSRVCRVLPVGTLTGNSGDLLLEEWLSVLLPLELPAQMGTAADPIGEVRRQMPDGIEPGLANAALNAAPRGSSAVQAELKRLLLAPLNQAEEKLDAQRSEADR